mmetsp:Transcript_2008/g.6085  ORF Transcript_2008/g.6085 Transcript_2008/m.6085 type:complete len:200 (-) Transcript_2008:10-609(-)
MKQSVTPEQVKFASQRSDGSLHSTINAKLFVRHFLLGQHCGVFSALHKARNDHFWLAREHQQIRTNSLQPLLEVCNGLQQKLGTKYASFARTILTLSEEPWIEAVHREDTESAVGSKETLACLCNEHVVCKTKIVPEPEDNTSSRHLQTRQRFVHLPCLNRGKIEAPDEGSKRRREEGEEEEEEGKGGIQGRQLERLRL